MEDFQINYQEFVGECGGHLLTKDADGALLIDGRADMGSGVAWVATTDTAIAVTCGWFGGKHCEFNIIDCNIAKVITNITFECKLEHLHSLKRDILARYCPYNILWMIDNKPTIDEKPEYDIVRDVVHVTWNSETHLFKLPDGFLNKGPLFTKHNTPVRDPIYRPWNIRVIDNCLVFGDNMYDHLAIKMITEHAKRYHMPANQPIARRLRHSKKHVAPDDDEKHTDK